MTELGLPRFDVAILISNESRMRNYLPKGTVKMIRKTAGKVSEKLTCTPSTIFTLPLGRVTGNVVSEKLNIPISPLPDSDGKVSLLECIANNILVADEVYVHRFLGLARRTQRKGKSFESDVVPRTLNGTKAIILSFEDLNLKKIQFIKKEDLN